MINLVITELKKILKRKSIYIIWIIMLIFCLLNNILYKTDYDENGNYKYILKENIEEESQKLKEELNKYDYNVSSEATMYITIKTKLEVLELKKKFSTNSWQYNKINDYLYDALYYNNHYKYIEKDTERYKASKQTSDLILQKLFNDDYQYFLNLELQKIDTQLNDIKTTYNSTNDKKQKQEIKLKLKEVEFNRKILQFRIQNNIKEDSGFLNKALENYSQNSKMVIYYDEVHQSKTHQEKLAYQTAISEAKISEYIITTKKNINKQNNLSYQLRTIIEDYELFIVVLILIVCSTTICDEFKDGTIKLLLIKPYSRGKILLSKFLTSVIILSISILLLIIIQLIIGGLIFNFDSLKLPVVIYDFNKSKLIEYPIFEYMLLRIVARIPFLLILIMITLFMGVLTNSSITTITLPLIIYMFTPTINSLANQYNLNFMKYLVNLNWDLQNCLFGKIHPISFINFKFSVFLITIYLISLWMITYTIFKRKDIKNI